MLTEYVTQITQGTVNFLEFQMTLRQLVHGLCKCVRKCYIA